MPTTSIITYPFLSPLFLFIWGPIHLNLGGLNHRACGQWNVFSADSVPVSSLGLKKY